MSLRTPPGDREALGRQGEQWVADALRERGFELLATNWRWTRGDIDIVARRGVEIWFVEVKTRQNARAMPELSFKQQTHQVGLAHTFLAQYDGRFESARFVVAFVRVSSSGHTIEWIEQAFESSF